MRETRFAVFGYDMDNMKARSWIESEMPLWILEEPATFDWVKHFIDRATAGASEVARMLTGAIKSALYDRPSDARGDYGFIAERFYRETEGAFYAALGEAAGSIRKSPDADNPTIQALENWAPVMGRAARRLFDEYAPADGLEDRDMHRYVKARFFLVMALGGRGKKGRLLFERDLGVTAPERANTKLRGAK